MSKQQWGHGYYQGLKDADAHVGIKRYIAITSADGHLQTLYRVLVENQDIFTVEDITYCTQILTLTGIPSMFGVATQDDPVDSKMVSEIEGNEEMIFFSSKQACEAWIINDYRDWIIEKP